MIIAHNSFDINSKYYKTYCSLINSAKNKNRIKYTGEYLETHHIIPKSLNGTDDKENLVLLTAREHYLAHKLLCKFSNSIKMVYAFWMFQTTSKYSIIRNCNDYKKCRENLIKILSDAHSNTIFINDDTKHKKIKETISIPEGWQVGRLPLSDIAKYNISQSQKNKKCITNGIEMTYIYDNIDILPEGWYFGVRNDIIESKKNKMPINNGSAHKFISITNDIPEGWIYGMSDIAKQKNSSKRKSQINITNGNITKIINANDDIQQGWYKGITRNNIKQDFIWVTNGTNNKMILKTDTIDNGWIYGRITSKNKNQYLWITNGIENIFVDRNNITQTGWKLGKCKLKKEDYKTTKDKIFITNGVQNKYINPIDEIPDGWYKGLSRTIKKSKFINNGYMERKLLIDEPLPDGWNFGRLFMSDDVKKKISQSASNKILITNGVVKKFINKNTHIPDEWYKVVI